MSDLKFIKLKDSIIRADSIAGVHIDRSTTDYTKEGPLCIVLVELTNGKIIEYFCGTEEESHNELIRICKALCEVGYVSEVDYVDD